MFLLIWFIIVCMIFSVFTKRILYLFVKWSLSYIHPIDWFFTCLDLYVIFFHLNCCSVYFFSKFRRMFSFYFCKITSSLYLADSWILHLLLSVCCYLYLVIWIISGCVLLAGFTRSDYFVWLWNEFYLIFSLYVDILLA